MNIKTVLLGAKMYMTKGWRKMGKCLMRKNTPQVIVAGYKDQLDNVLRHAGLPESDHLADLDSGDSHPTDAEPTFPEVESAPTGLDAFRAAQDALSYMVMSKHFFFSYL